MTGLSENHAVKIGVGVNDKIKILTGKITNIKNNIRIPMKIKKTNERRIERKITYLIDDLQWKTIKYLTNNYNNILLGDMSAKSIIDKKKSILKGEMKNACERTRYYQFQQRLEYKCKIYGIRYKLVDEKYTSKTCSICGNINDKLGGNKIYKCNKCENIMDRDINACRNIYIKQRAM